MGRAEIKTANFFSALQNTTSCKKQPKAVLAAQQEHKAVVWTLKPITSWADCEDEDDDEFYVQVVPLAPAAPHPLIPDQTIREEESDLQEYAEGPGEDEEEKTPEAEAKDKETGPIFPVQKPLPKAPSQLPVLTKKEQRRRELEEIDSVLAELGWTQPAPATKPLQEREEEEHRRRPSQGLFNKPNISTGTRPLTCEPTKELKPFSTQEAHAAKVKGVIDHGALRKKVIASGNNSQRGNVKRGNGCTASTSSLPCKAAVAEASARTAKVAAAKKKARSKQWNH